MDRRILIFILISLISFSMVNYNAKAISASETSVDQIIVDGDTELQDLVSDMGLSGSGTINDPFVLSLLVFNANVTFFIEIQNTDLYTTISECTFDGKLNLDNQAINLVSVKNIIVKNSYFIDNEKDIIIDQTSSIEILNNEFTMAEDFNYDYKIHEDNIKITAGNSIKIFDNVFKYKRAILLVTSSEVDVFNNQFNHTIGHSIRVERSENITIRYNEFTDGSHSAVEFWTTANSNILHNTVRGTSSIIGTRIIALYGGSHANNISLNIITTSRDEGIMLYSDTENNIISNNIISGALDGIKLSSGSESSKPINNLIFNNIIENNRRYGITLGYDEYSKDNYLYTRDNMIFNNNFIENAVSPQIFSQDTTYANNNITKNYYSDHDNTDDDNDGFSDTSYVIVENEVVDDFPLASIIIFSDINTTPPTETNNTPDEIPETPRLNFPVPIYVLIAFPMLIIINKLKKKLKE